MVWLYFLFLLPTILVFRSFFLFGSIFNLGSVYIKRKKKKKRKKKNRYSVHSVNCQSCALTIRLKQVSWVRCWNGKSLSQTSLWRDIRFDITKMHAPFKNFCTPFNEDDESIRNKWNRSTKMCVDLWPGVVAYAGWFTMNWKWSDATKRQTHTYTHTHAPRTNNMPNTKPIQ